MFEVVEVVFDPFGDAGITAQAVDLGPASESRLGDVSSDVRGDNGGKLTDKVGALGTRSEEAHIAA